MLNNIEDLLNINSEIAELDVKRSKLGEQLSIAQQKILTETEKSNLYETIANDIIDNVKDVEDINVLRQKYGTLTIFDDLESKFQNKKLMEIQLNKLANLTLEVEKLCTSDVTTLSFYDITTLHESLNEIAINSIIEGNSSISDVLNRFDEQIISRYAEHITKEYTEQLLNSKWDVDTFLLSDSETVEKLKKTSSLLFKLTKLYFKDSNKAMWNFQCIANNFKIRFTYHFHNNSTTIDLYFRFLNDYLKDNLYKCINIFEDPSIGLTKTLIHKEFINHILDPIRERVSTTLLENDSKNFIALISQIISTDKNLINQFYYRGQGLVTLVSAESWEKWLGYEISMARRQYETITNGPKDLFASAFNFCKLFKKVYEYLEPFYQLDYEPLERFKLQTCSKIFLELSSEYLDFVMTTDSLGEQRTKEEELFQTIMKMQNLNIVYQMIYELSENVIFTQITNVVNKRELKNYISIFQNVLDDYKNNMKNDLQNSIIHRVQKLIKESLQNYFKVNNWLLSGSERSLTPSSEIVNCINMLRRIVGALDSLNIPVELVLNIKNEFLNRIVNYFVESILKLNKFNQQGLAQFDLDFCTVKDTLNIAEDAINCQEMIMLEILKVLSLKYDNNVQRFIESLYIKNGDFSDLKEYMPLRWLENQEIQDALYRISYNHIV